MRVHTYSYFFLPLSLPTRADQARSRASKLVSQLLCRDTSRRNRPSSTGTDRRATTKSHRHLALVHKQAHFVKYACPFFLFVFGPFVFGKFAAAAISTSRTFRKVAAITRLRTLPPELVGLVVRQPWRTCWHFRDDEVPPRMVLRCLWVDVHRSHL